MAETPSRNGFAMTFQLARGVRDPAIGFETMLFHAAAGVFS